MNFYSRISDLKLEIEDFQVDSQSIQAGENFTRKTSTVTLEGKNREGKGEDVIYERGLHEYPSLEELEGNYEFDEFSRKLEKISLFRDQDEAEKIQKNYRRWALESAALDLALRQSNKRIDELLELKPDHLNFIVSPSMDETDIQKLRELRQKVPGIEFKIDVKQGWSPETIRRLDGTNAVRVVDFKSHYDGLGTDPDPKLYSMVADEISDAILEDPVINKDTRDAFEGHESRVTWDKPITSLGKVEKLPFEVEHLNIKPSRFGSFRSLFRTLEHCMKNDIQMYAGGQFELDVGRSQAQLIASIFYADSPNDIAPKIYNTENGDNLPESPLDLRDSFKGFRDLDWY